MTHKKYVTAFGFCRCVGGIERERVSSLWPLMQFHLYLQSDHECWIGNLHHSQLMAHWASSCSNPTTKLCVELQFCNRIWCLFVCHDQDLHCWALLSHSSFHQTTWEKMYGTFNSIEQKLIQILGKYTANDLPMPMLMTRSCLTHHPCRGTNKTK